VAWDEVSFDVQSDHFNVTNIGKQLKQLREDPWARYATIRQALPRVVRWD
jgi:DNA primase